LLVKFLVFSASGFK